jgi:glycosyltransferase involved in cell wall biosynthesis
MKILRISQTYPTKENNGKGLHAYNYSNNIDFPTVVLTKFYNESYLDSNKNVKLYPIKYWQIPFDNSKKYNNLIALLSFIIGQITFFIKSLKIILIFKPDIIHSQSPHSMLIAFFSKIIIRSKLFLTFHGSDLKRLKKISTVMKILNFYDKIFYVSNQMKPELIRYYSNEKLFYTPSGLDREFFLEPPNVNIKVNQFLAVGNIRWQKDYATMIKAFRIFNQKFKNYKLLIIGNYNYDDLKYKEIINLIKKYRLENFIEFKGSCDRLSVKNEMYRSKALLMSSVSEGMPKVIHEAKCCGLPIISSNVGSCKEIIRIYGYTFPAKDFKLMSILMEKLINNPQNLTGIKDSTKQYSWKVLSNRIEKQFKESLM